MNIILFTHPQFVSSKSMPKYANMIAQGMRERGHTVEIWTAKEKFFKLPFPKRFKKWLGYIDQFVLFPIEVRRNLEKCQEEKLFVFVDQALGPWIPLVSKFPHAVHCHDFLAQRSALGRISENKIGVTGKVYQKMIRKGYQKAENFISISHNTQKDLHLLLKTQPRISEVIYNGLNQNFNPGNVAASRKELGKKNQIAINRGYILHVGGNQFYKNRKGVIRIFNAWREIASLNIPLIMIGPEPTQNLIDLRDQSKYQSDIHFLSNVSDEDLRMAYQGANVFLFPSLEEGFGWPIAEAMASGCPVITTGKPPMNEVGADACFYLDAENNNKDWEKNSAQLLNKVVELSKDERENIINKGIENAKRFCAQKALAKIELVYKQILNSYIK